MTSPTTSTVFSTVKFYLTGHPQSHTVSFLTGGGGRRLSYLSSLATHCIAAEQPDHMEMAEAEEMLEVPVVTEEWVIASVKCGHILPVRGFSTSGSQLFSGVTMVLDRDTVGKEDCEKLWAMVTWYGGRVGEVEEVGTHLVRGRGNWKNHQIKNVKMIEVTPDWMVDSVRDGVKRKEEDYQPSCLVAIELNTEDDLDTSDPPELSTVGEAGREGSIDALKMVLLEEKEVDNCAPSSRADEDSDPRTVSKYFQIHTNNSQNLPEQRLPSNSKSSTDHIESSLSSSYCSVFSMIPQEEKDTTSDYFSQGTESSEQNHNPEIERSTEDMFVETPLKKRKLTDDQESALLFSRWSETDKFRTAYTRTEAMALINFFMDQGVYFMKGGIQIWKVVEKSCICPGRSWQSLKQFFLKHLLKRLPSFGVTEEELKEKARKLDDVKRWGSGKRRSSEIEVVASYYTMAEDKKILNFIINHGRVEKISTGGNKIWQMMEKKTVLVGRSWQSMKERFRKRISLNLKKYDLSEGDLEDIGALMK